MSLAAILVIGFTKVSPTSHFQVLTVQENDLEAIDAINRRIRDINLSYEVFVASTSREVTNIERNFNAILLSRSGFVFQDLKDLEYEIRNEIYDRMSGAADPICFLQARSDLETAAEAAGTSSDSAYRDVISRLRVMHILQVYPTLTEINREINKNSMETIRLLGAFNSVTNVDGLLTTLDGEIGLFEELFEQFVEQVLSEMIIYERYLMRSLVPVLVTSLEETRTTFVNETNAIRTTIAACE